MARPTETFQSVVSSQETPKPMVRPEEIPQSLVRPQVIPKTLVRPQRTPRSGMRHKKTLWSVVTLQSLYIYQETFNPVVKVRETPKFVFVGWGD